MKNCACKIAVYILSQTDDKNNNNSFVVQLGPYTHCIIDYKLELEFGLWSIVNIQSTALQMASQQGRFKYLLSVKS